MVLIDGKEYETHSEYFKKHPDKLAINKRRNAKIIMNAYAQPCTDCRLVWHPASMTLDHIERDGYKTTEGKRKHPSNMLPYPTELFVAELSKCEVVCSNCHKLREMERDGVLNRKRWLKFSKHKRAGALLLD